MARLIQGLAIKLVFSKVGAIEEIQDEDIQDEAVNRIDSMSLRYMNGHDVCTIGCILSVGCRDLLETSAVTGGLC